ncbi:MAG: DNA primase family protein [Beijerinckiaceae bacterium]
MIDKMPPAIPPDDAAASIKASGLDAIIDTSNLVILDFEEARAAAAKGQAKPPKGGGECKKNPPPPDDKDSFHLRLAGFPMTDLGNAERFVARYKDSMRFCPDIGWLWWDGKRWARTGSEEIVKERIISTVRYIQNEARALQGSRQDVLLKRNFWLSDKLAAWGLASESSRHLSVIAHWAVPYLAIAGDELDADKMKFNVANGTLHIARRDEGEYVELRPHDPADYVTKLSPVIFDREAACPRFDRFMDEVQPPDAAGKREVARFLDQWAGLSLTGDTSEQKITFHYGKGRNGKSVWVSAISYVAGDYADSIPIESFMDAGRARAGGQATPDIACLPGVRMLTTSEPKRGATLDEGLIKLFSGGDRIKARHLHKDFFAFVPQAKLTMQGNYRPKVLGADEGIWNRLVLVPWGVFFPPEKRDPNLLKTLKGEASGILNRLLDGLCTWLDHGLQIPGSVARATEDYRSDSDPLGRLLDACTRAALGERVQASDMHAVFSAWAKINGETLWSAKGLGAALRERGIAVKKSVNVYWLDIQLTKRAEDFLDASGNPKHGDEHEVGEI